MIQSDRGAKLSAMRLCMTNGKNYIFTSESVCSGHPDKICDSISDAILDEVLKLDPNGRVAVETLATKNKLIIAGEISANAKVNYDEVARKRIQDLGYTDSKYNFTNRCEIDIYLQKQSGEIAQGVNDKGAGDQGMMFGFACLDTIELMPLPITLAHKLAEAIDIARVSSLPYLRPDGKTQVTIEYKNGKPKKILQVVLAVPHQENIKLNEVKNDLFQTVVKPVLEKYDLSISINHLVLNGTGVWHIGGPAMDTGLTGRKIIIDGYGGMGRVGGGAFSGKDPTKVDRSGAYAARFLAKNIVAAKLAEKCEVRVAYFIGAKKPVMLEAETFGTNKKSEKIIKEFMNNLLDTSVSGIIKRLNLNQPIYLKTSTYGHFGRPDFPWEKIIS